MIHLIYIYLIINSFIAGYWFKENYKWESKSYTFTVSFLALLFGVVGYLIYFFLILFAPILGWLYKELQFWYRFKFSNYYDKVYLDDSYSSTYRTKEEKLKRTKQLVERGSKQNKRHNRLIQKRYGSDN